MTQCIRPEADDKSPIAAAARKVARLLGDLETYVSGQSDIIIDYATAHRREEPISTAMRWSPRGAHEQEHDS